MEESIKRIILASASPRRLELMLILGRMYGVEIVQEVSKGDETSKITDPATLVRELAEKKTMDVAGDHPMDLVIGADTIVCIDDMILGKPKDAGDAERILCMLSGRTHRVYTGVCMIYKDYRECFYEMTEVTMNPLSGRLIEKYILTGEPFDKAGAYGIQGPGAVLIQGIRGDYYNVMGLPVARVAQKLKNILDLE